jgi:hypothetical protein
MARWKQVALVTLWALSLVIAAAWGARAQGQAPEQKPQPPVQVTTWAPRVYSGDDIGFRVRQVGRDGRPQGVFVVRIDGAWVEVTGAARTYPLR